MDPAMAAEDVSKAYGGTTALRGVSLSVAPGEVLALVGPNGAGKTTLVRCLTGTVRPDDGTVRLLGAAPAAADAERIGLLPQDFAPPDRLTAAELLGYYAGLYDQARSVEAVLDQVGLTEAAGTQYRHLSGGQRRRALVGAALVNEPEVLFLDEPTTGIDPRGRRAVWSLIEALASGGTTVLLTTHSMGEVDRLADRVGVLVDGELAAIGTAEELVAEYGGPSRLIVETDAPTQALEALDYLEARASDDGVVVDRLPASRLGEVVDVLDEAGIGYGRIGWSEPDLERVYLDLTGERDQHRVRGSS